jgi:hypothetical protein
MEFLLVITEISHSWNEIGWQRNVIRTCEHPQCFEEMEERIRIPLRTEQDTLTWPVVMCGDWLWRYQHGTIPALSPLSEVM